MKTIFVIVLGLCGVSRAQIQDGLSYVETVTSESARGGVISGDGAFMYVGGAGLRVYERALSSGILSQQIVQLLPEVDVGVVGTPASGEDSAISADGAHLYAVSFTLGVVLVYSRDSMTGTLSLVEYHRDGVAGIAHLDGANRVIISPDGLYVYVKAVDDDAIVVFLRNPTTGKLTLSSEVVNGIGGVGGMDTPVEFALSPDGAHLYVQANDLCVFSRNAMTGALTQVAQIDTAGGYSVGSRGIAVSPDGGFVYAGSLLNGGVVVFSRNLGTGAVSFLQHVPSANQVLRVSNDGTRLYAVGDFLSATNTFARDAGTGLLTPGDVETAPGGGLLRDVELSPDGRYLYLTSTDRIITYQRVRVRCRTTPMAGCVAGSPGTGRLALRNRPDPGKDTMKWKWIPAGVVPGGTFGDPANTTDYATCVYDDGGAPQLRLQLRAPAGGGCAGKACWRPQMAGVFGYKDKIATPDGIQKMRVDPQKRVTLKARTAELDASSVFPLTGPVRVQLQTSDGQCVENVFTVPTINAGDRYEAKSD